MKKILVLVFCIVFVSGLLPILCSAEGGESHYIEVSISQCRLWLYEVKDNERLLVK